MIKKYIYSNNTILLLAMLQSRSWVYLHRLFHSGRTRTIWGCFNSQMKNMRLREIQPFTQPRFEPRQPDLGACTLTSSVTHGKVQLILSLSPCSGLMLPLWTVPTTGGVLWETLWMLFSSMCKANKGYFYHLPQIPLIANFLGYLEENIGKGGK